ncbi:MULTISPECIES: lactonase family protein [unclassified Streptomyces]|uniref:lactonase family protein n=1 Tax=unclassified Streptomyces TaxID=2593676 RepID=UPI0036895E59
MVVSAEHGGRSGSRWAYIGSFTAGGGDGITVAEVRDEDGALVPRATVATVENPSWLALDPGTGVLYAASDTERGAVAALRAEGERLTPLGPAVEVGGEGPAYVDFVGRRVLTAHYGSGGVGTLPVREDGSLTGPPVVLAHRGSGPDPERQRSPHAHQVLPDPGGRWVLSVDLGTDSVRVCALDPETGALRVHSETVLRAGSGPRHLAFHPDGTLVYVLHELEPQLTVCRWEAEAGRLETLAEVAVDTTGLPAGERAYPSVVSVSPDGRFVRAAVRGSDRVLTFDLTDDAGKPQLVDVVECGGSWPRDLVTDASGRRVYVVNEWSGDITWFDADPETGRLVRAGAVAVPAAACLVLA